MERDDLADPPGHPFQRKDYDLSRDTTEVVDPAKRPKLAHDDANTRSPASMMRQMGFDPSKKMTPLQFLVAVFNDDIDLIFKNPKRLTQIQGKGGMGMSYRLEAAKTAARYMHMEMPKVQLTAGADENFGQQLADAVSRGGERIRTKRIILETVERISPDIPLPPASYPPEFQDAIEGHVVREMGESEAEGDTDYNPDDDD